MSSAEIEVQLVENNEAFTIKIKLNDESMSATALREQATESVARLMAAISDHAPSNI